MEIKSTTSTIIIDKEKDTVEKTIDYGEFTEELYLREVYWLNKLRETGFVPKIKELQPEKYKIIMTYCGEQLKEINDFHYKQLCNIKNKLSEKKCFYNDWKMDNLTELNDKLYLIDFGWASMIIEDFTCGGEVETELKTKFGGIFFTI